MTDTMMTPRETAEQCYGSWFAFNELYAQWARRFGMNVTILFCLYAIRRSKEEPTPSYVAATLRLSKQTVNSALDILEKRGFITRRIDPLNRRSRRITMTEQGMAQADLVLEALYELEEKVFGKLTQRDRKAACRLATQLTEQMEKSI